MSAILGRVHAKVSPLAVKALALFFLVLPFSYLLQVLAQTPYVGVAPYLLLVGCLVLLGKDLPHGAGGGFADPLSIGFILLFLHHVVMSWVVGGENDAGLVVRALVLFTLPLMLFWAPRAIELAAQELVFKMLSVGAAIVSLELLYENVITQVFEKSSSFQLLNKAYLHEVLGTKELGQLWWAGYRATGLIEHPHATAFFCNVGLCVATVLYVYRGRIPYLIFALVCTLAVWTQGFRLPVLAQIAAIAVLGAFMWMDKNVAVRRRVVVFMFWFAASCIFVAVADPTHVAHRYYFPSFRGDFQLSKDMDVGMWIRYTADDLIQQSYLMKWMNGEWGLWREALFGHGLVGSLSGRYPFSDDFFLLALPLQYGLLGAIVFGGIWVLAIGRGFIDLIRYRASPLPVQLRIAGLIGLSTMLLLALSMVHSGVLQRKAIYPLFPFFAGVLARLHMDCRKWRSLDVPVFSEANELGASDPK